MGDHKYILLLPLNTPGHINSGLAIADKLSSSYGYRSVFVTIGRSIAEIIREHGHELIELQDESESSEQVTTGTVEFWSNIFVSSGDPISSAPYEVCKRVMGTFSKNYVPMLIANYHQYKPIIDKYRPALILIDHICPPPCVLSDDGRTYPWVRIQSANPLQILKGKELNKLIRPTPLYGLSIPSKQERMRMREQEPEKWTSILAHWEALNTEIAPLMRQSFKPIVDFYRISQVPNETLELMSASDTIPIISSPILNTYIFPQALDYDQDDDLFEYPKDYVRCESLIRESAPNQAVRDHWLSLIEEKSQGKEARVLFSLGSIVSGDPKLIGRYVDWLGQDTNRLYIISKGFNGDKVELNQNNQIGGNYIPQPFLLQHVDLAIIHGGNNGITECLHYGVPMIVLPFFGDQFDNAQRVEDLGLGKRLDLHSCTRTQLQAIIEAVLENKTMRTRVKHIGEQMRARDDLAQISETLHKLAQKY